MKRAAKPDPERERGVFEIELRARDWRGFEVKNSDGAVKMYVEWPKSDVTQAKIDGLWKWLDEIDPPGPTLRLA